MKLKLGDRIRFTADAKNALEETFFEVGEIATVVSIGTAKFVLSAANRVKWLPEWAQYALVTDGEDEATARSLYATFNFVVSSIVASNLAAPDSHAYLMVPWEMVSDELRDLLTSVADEMHEQMSGRKLRNILRHIDNAVARYRMENVGL